jgi:hypothetical protein
MRFILTCVSLLFLNNCSSTISNGSSSNLGQYSKPLGVSYRAEFAGVIRVVIENKHQYVIIRQEETARDVYIETDWKERNVFEDEEEKDIVSARTRLIFRARPRHAGQYTIHMFADNEVIIKGMGSWQLGSFSPMLQASLNDISKELRIEYKVLF